MQADPISVPVATDKRGEFVDEGAYHSAAYWPRKDWGIAASRRGTAPRC